MALRALAIILAAGLCATPTPTAAAGCMPMDKPQLLTKENDLNLVANDVVFHHGTQRCNVTSITSVVADLAALGASVSQASATAKQDLVQGLGTASSALADLATKTSKDLAAEAKRIEDGHAADLAKLKKDLTVSYEAKLKLELQKQAADFGKQLAAIKLTIQQQAKDGAKANDAQDAANKKSNTAMTAAISSTKNDFQMPILKGWKHGASVCVRVRVCASARARARVHVCIRVCACARARVRTRVHMCVWLATFFTCVIAENSSGSNLALPCTCT